jgi:pyruvate dehydrogenase E2 component (dihydrolipoamide acetyltransferase)
MATEFKLPELGEGIESGTVAGIPVSKGDKIKKDQTVMELETDKAVLELPSEVSGVIKEIKVKEGDEVKVGQTLLTVEEDKEAQAEDDEGDKVETGKKTGEEEKKEEKSAAEEKDQEEEKNADGTKEEGKEEKKSKEETAQKEKEADEERADEKEETAEQKDKDEKPPVPASPATRRIAREIGIDINDVPGTGKGGRITVDDVKAFAKKSSEEQTSGGKTGATLPAEALPDFSKWGTVERKPMSATRKKTATHLSYAWATIPHVTQFDKADMTELEKLRHQYAEKVEKQGGKLTITAILLKIVAAALKLYPKFNASIDMENEEIIYKQYCHIGVAVDTDRGLLVPVIRNVNHKNIIDLALELNEIAEKARNKKLSREDMQGGNFSISNLGGIGGTGFTPVVNTPEVAVLGVARSRMEQVYINDTFESRLILPLALSYDHRLIDGADAARFLRWIAEAVEQPFMIVLGG